MASGALVALLNTTNNRCYSTLREFFVPHQRLLVLLRLDHDPSLASGAMVALLNTTNNRCYSTLREFFPPSHTCIYE